MTRAFMNVRGMVVSPNTWSETSVSGYVPAAQTGYISSTSHERTRFFIREDIGREVPVEVSGEFAVREGHDVTAIFFGGAAPDSNPVACLNHTTGRDFVNKNIIHQNYGGNKQGCASDILIILSIIIAIGSLIIAIQANSPVPLIFTALATILFFRTNRNMRRPTRRRSEGEAAVRAELQRVRDRG